MAEEAQEVEINPLQDLVQHALDQDYNKANQAFGDAMTVKLNDVMDQEQVKLASQIYNGVPEDEEEQLNLDLGDESEEESEYNEDEADALDAAYNADDEEIEDEDEESEESVEDETS